jgi:glyoxylase-like metal-dependent hydrolase (beta-lactamase superfamily II)
VTRRSVPVAPSIRSRSRSAWTAPGRPASLGALFVSDAFATYAVTTGARGPQVAPFTADATQAVQSLTRLEAISADYVLTGHRDPWTGGIQEAVQQIRQAQGSSG